MKKAKLDSALLCLLMAALLAGCTTSHKFPMQNVFPANEAINCGGPSVTLESIQETMSDPNTAAPYQADPNYLGKGLNILMGYGPVPILPFMIKYDEFQADTSRMDIVRAALLSQMNSNGIPVVFKTDTAGQISGLLPQDRLNVSVNIRKMTVDTEMNFFLTLIIDSYFEFRNQVANVELDCKIRQSGQAQPIWEGVFQGHCRTKERLKQLPQTFEEIIKRINVVKEAASEAAGKCAAKIAEVRTKVSSERYARLMKEGADLEAGGDTAKALEDYGQASTSATTAGQDDEAMQALVRLLRVTGTPPEMSADARKLKVQAEAAYRDGRFDEAAQLYADTVALAPWWAEGHQELAQLLGAGGHYAQAIREMKRYQLLNPNTTDTHGSQDKIYEWEQKMAAQTQAVPSTPPAQDSTDGSFRRKK